MFTFGYPTGLGALGISGAGVGLDVVHESAALVTVDAERDSLLLESVVAEYEREDWHLPDPPSLFHVNQVRLDVMAQNQLRLVG